MTHLTIGTMARASRGGRITDMLRDICAMWLRRHREAEAAAELMTFSDRALADLGIGRCEIEARVRFPANPND